MSTVVANMSMSLDGFIEGPGGDVGALFAWCGAGAEVTRAPGGGPEFRTSSASAELLREAWAGLGALVCGRRLFDLTHGWGGRHPVDVPVFVVTHRPPGHWDHPEAPFTFVLDGVASAVDQARAAAGARAVAVASADVARQCLELGLLDAIAVDLVPVLLGGGRPWFAHLPGVVALEDPVVTPGEGVTHLRYRVRRAPSRDG
jgi:dihydrofolate reductase